MKRKIWIFLLAMLPVFAWAGLETATFISQLNANNPTGNDSFATADDHIRLLKSTIKNTFPNVTGAVTTTQAELNNLVGSAGAVNSATNLTTGTLADARLSANVALINGNPNFTGTGPSINGTSIRDTSILTSGTLGVARGGTGIASFTTGNYINASGATSLQQRTPAQVLSDIGGASSVHTHGASDITSGTLAVARGGTGVTTSTGSGNTVLSASPALTGSPTIGGQNICLANGTNCPSGADYAITATSGASSFDRTSSNATSWSVVSAGTGLMDVTMTGINCNTQKCIVVCSDSSGSATFIGVNNGSNTTNPGAFRVFTRNSAGTLTTLISFGCLVNVN